MDKNCTCISYSFQARMFWDLYIAFNLFAGISLHLVILLICLPGVAVPSSFKAIAVMQRSNKTYRRKQARYILVYASFYKRRSDISHPNKQAGYPWGMPRSISEDPT